MHHFGMELDAVEGTVAMADGGDRGVGRVGDDPEIGWYAGEMIAVAHPDGEKISQPVKERRGLINLQLGATVLPLRRPVDLPAAEVADHLQTVADAENGDLLREEGGIGQGGLRAIDRRGSTREDNPLRLDLRQLGRGD